MDQVLLSGRTEESAPIDLRDVAYRQTITPPHDRGIAQSSEEGLDMVGDPETELLVHGFGHAGLHGEALAPGKPVEAPHARFPVPGAETNGVEMVDPIRDAEPARQRFESDTSGDDETERSALDLLERATQPTEKDIHSVPTVGIPKRSLQEDGQFIQNEKDRLFVLGTVSQELAAVALPGSRIQLGADPDLEITDANLVQVFAHPTSEALAESIAQRSHRVRGAGDVRDHVFRVVSPLHVCEEEHPSIGFQATPKFSGEAGLPHPPLAREQHVVVFARQIVEQSQLGFAVEEVFATDPAARGHSHLSVPPFSAMRLDDRAQLQCCQLTCCSESAVLDSTCGRRPDP